VSLHDGGTLAAGVWDTVRRKHLAPSEYQVRPLRPWDWTGVETPKRTVIPPLLKGYLRLGAYVCGAPAHDPDFGVADLNAPTPTLPVPTITTTDPAPGAPNPGLASGPDRVARVGGVDTESELSTVAPTQPVPSSVPTTADATEPNHARTVVGASSGSGGSSSRWLWLVSGGFGLIVLTAGGRLVMRRRRLADELSKLDSRRR